MNMINLSTSAQGSIIATLCEGDGCPICGTGGFVERTDADGYLVAAYCSCGLVRAKRMVTLINGINAPGSYLAAMRGWLKSPAAYKGASGWLYGREGAGKTHLALQTSIACISAGRSACYCKASLFAMALTADYGRPSADAETAAMAHLVILDEVDKVPARRMADLLGWILDRHDLGKGLLLISQSSPQDVCSSAGDEHTGRALWSRARQWKIHEMSGADRRKGAA